MATISRTGYALDPISPSERDRLAQRLTPEERYVLFDHGTERPFCGGLLDNKEPGVYACRLCSLPLFQSDTKFESGTGWPSFFTTIPGAFAKKTDYKLVLPRTEYHCARCAGHSSSREHPEVVTAALADFITPALAYDHPEQVLRDDALGVSEKRAILSSWASDANAVEHQPWLRRLPGSGRTIPLAAILSALRRLDDSDPPPEGAAAVPPAMQERECDQDVRGCERGRGGVGRRVIRCGGGSGPAAASGSATAVSQLPARSARPAPRRASAPDRRHVTGRN